MSRRSRSAGTGRYVTRAASRRNPSTTVVESVKPAQGGSPVKVARSVITGRFISKAVAARHPGTTVIETIRR